MAIQYESTRLFAIFWILTIVLTYAVCINNLLDVWSSSIALSSLFEAPSGMSAEDVVFEEDFGTGGLTKEQEETMSDEWVEQVTVS